MKNQHREIAPPSQALRSVVPPYLLDAIAERGADRFPRAAAAARSCRPTDGECRRLRAAGLREAPVPEDAPPAVRAEARAGGLTRFVHDAQNREELPGLLVRSEGSEPVDDVAVNEAYDGLGASYRLFAEVFGRDSLDGRGMPLSGTVHFGQDYDNAFFDGRQMVFGDGDDQVFTGFTGSLSIIGHELSHGVVAHTADLEYQGQPGALNEHVADVFGALTEQYERGEDARSASWLIGAGIFTSAVTGDALRNMLAPGTAYDDDVLGKDPQPGHMDDYIDTASDNGGVHLNSGIPNRAFATAATTVGGRAWETVGQVWFSVLIGDDIGTRTDFAQFAQMTIAEAAVQFGEGTDVHDAIVQGWQTVGISRAGSGRGNRGSSW